MPYFFNQIVSECFQNDTYDAPLGRPFFSECRVSFDLKLRNLYLKRSEKIRGKSGNNPRKNPGFFRLVFLAKELRNINVLEYLETSTKCL